MSERWTHVDTARTPPVMTLPPRYNASIDLVDRHVDEGRGHRIAFIDDAGAVTFSELRNRPARVAGIVRALGVHPEQRVLRCLQDTFDFPSISFGAIRAGAVPVPVNTNTTWRTERLLRRES